MRRVVRRMPSRTLPKAVDMSAPSQLGDVPPSANLTQGCDECNLRSGPRRIDLCCRGGGSPLDRHQYALHAEDSATRATALGIRGPKPFRPSDQDTKVTALLSDAMRSTARNPRSQLVKHRSRRFIVQ